MMVSFLDISVKQIVHKLDVKLLFKSLIIMSISDNVLLVFELSKMQ